MSRQVIGSAIAVALFSIMTFMASAQEATEEQDTQDSETLPIDSEWVEYRPSMYSKGDQTFLISLGSLFPSFFSGESGTLDMDLNVGGTGSLNYNYFMNSNVSLGGEFGGMFGGTRAKNMLYIVLYGFKASYQFVINRFEIPLSLSIGGASQTYLDTNYFGLYAKPAASVFWRFTPDWSFGLNTAWWWLPQWVEDSKENVYGNFVEVTLSARFHF